MIRRGGAQHVAVLLLFAVALLCGVASPQTAARGDEALAGAPVTVPFELVDNHIFVQVELNGRGPYTVALDSGASNTMTPQVASELGVPRSTRTFRVGGVGERTEPGARTRVASLRLGGVELTDQRFTVLSLSDVRRSSGTPQFDGLIGRELFARYVVTIDYTHRQLVFREPSTFAYRGTGTVVPFRFYGGMPEISATVDGLAGEFTVDTGDRLSLTLMEPFVQRHHLVARYRPKIAAISGWGIGGPVRGYVTRVGHLRFGAVDVAAPVTRLPQMRAGFFTDRNLAGSIGDGICRRFTLTLDYAHKRLIFEEEREQGETPRPDVFDRSGMWLAEGEDGRIEVVDLVPGGPAEKAGVRVGDAITAVDGHDPSALELSGLREQLKGPPGTHVQLTLVRSEDGGVQQRSALLTLEELV